MMHLYGASDDLLEVAGDWSEEFDVYTNASDGLAAACSDGTVVKFALERNGIWRATVINTGFHVARVVSARGEDAGRDEHGCPGYSDRVDIIGDIGWVALVTAVATPKGRLL